MATSDDGIEKIIKEESRPIGINFVKTLKDLFVATILYGIFLIIPSDFDYSEKIKEKKRIALEQQQIMKAWKKEREAKEFAFSLDSMKMIVLDSIYHRRDSIYQKEEILLAEKEFAVPKNAPKFKNPFVRLDQLYIKPEKIGKRRWISKVALKDRDYFGSDEEYEQSLLKGDTTKPNIKIHMTLKGAYELNKKAYEEEKIAMKTVEWAKIELDDLIENKSKDTLLMKALEYTILNAIPKYIGSKLLNTGDNKKIKKYQELANIRDLVGINCESGTLGFMGAASGDSTDYDLYMSKKLITGEYQEYVASDKFIEGYVTVLFARNTTSDDEKYRYKNGSEDGGSAKSILRRIINYRANFYAPIDYVVRDEDLASDGIKYFLEVFQSYGFYENHDKWHTVLGGEGNMVEVLWNNDPKKPTIENFRAGNVFNLSRIFDRLVYEQIEEEGQPSQDIQLSVGYFPKGLIEYFTQHYTYDATKYDNDLATELQYTASTKKQDKKESH